MIVFTLGVPSWNPSRGVGSIGRALGYGPRGWGFETLTPQHTGVRKLEKRLSSGGSACGFDSRLRYPLYPSLTRGE